MMISFSALTNKVLLNPFSHLWVIKSHSRGFVQAKIGAEILLICNQRLWLQMSNLILEKKKGLFSPLYLWYWRRREVPLCWIKLCQPISIITTKAIFKRGSLTYSVSDHIIQLHNLLVQKWYKNAQDSKTTQCNTGKEAWKDWLSCHWNNFGSWFEYHQRGYEKLGVKSFIWGS